MLDERLDAVQGLKGLTCAPVHCSLIVKFTALSLSLLMPTADLRGMAVLFLGLCCTQQTTATLDAIRDAVGSILHKEM